MNKISVKKINFEEVGLFRRLEIEKYLCIFAKIFPHFFPIHQNYLRNGY